MRSLRLSIAIVGLVLLAGTAGAAAQAAPGPAPQGPVQVGVVTLKAQAVPITTELPGRIAASASADVRPQVGGIIEAVNFKAGQQVKAGDVLYEIGDDAYKAQVDLQAAAVQKAEAAVSSAQSKVTRYQQLASNNNVSASDLQDAQAALAEATADVASARATLSAAQINEQLTKVTAPISGLISDSAVTAGALVTAAQTTALATIRQLDPSFVNVVETSTNLLRVRTQFENGSLKGTKQGADQTATVHLTLEDGSAYPEAGQLTFRDVVVSESTGTFTGQGTVPNPRRLLLPGMFVRATVDLGTSPAAFLVPQRSVTFDATGQPTALFVESGKAVAHTLTTNGNSGNNWIVTGGVNDGAQVIVDGLQKVTNGAAVTAIAVTLDANGVAVEPTPAPAAAATATAVK